MAQNKLSIVWFAMLVTTLECYGLFNPI